MNKKEIISYFDQRFLALLKKFPTALRLANEILCGFYLSSLPTTAAVFVMNKYLQTLNENFEETDKFEQSMVSLGKSINGDDSKPSGGQEKKNVPQK